MNQIPDNIRPASLTRINPLALGPSPQRRDNRQWRPAVPRLLIAEDERKLLRSLQRGLEAEGFEVDTASTGDETEKKALGGSFDCIVLDWMMPGKDGLQVLAALRCADSRVPILMLTARDAIEDRVNGLTSGADDYLVKPFAFAELLARIQALLRRGSAERETVLRAGGLEIDLIDRRVTCDGEELALRGREFEVLVYLLRHRDIVVTREMLGREVWKDPEYTLTNVIDVTITLLRKKLEKVGLSQLIQTVRGEGYRLSGTS
jgi:DNA-binding response OmpR family regulator